MAASYELFSNNMFSGRFTQQCFLSDVSSLNLQVTSIINTTKMSPWRPVWSTSKNMSKILQDQCIHSCFLIDDPLEAYPWAQGGPGDAGRQTSIYPQDLRSSGPSALRFVSKVSPAKSIHNRRCVLSARCLQTLQ